MGFSCRMSENQEQEEVITVRVQDPRVQNEGSWNSYVDYKIFLHMEFCSCCLGWSAVG
ncbi:SNX11 isoform 9 [Pongo abelii]|uniref:SNX11 isoform 9 n=1 Tax=Pongo abelii TaxID=9601 RepID=A0A2J8W9A7_PONAB|nr:SNX11 isoform 9 [Pongo abelii]